MISKGKLERSKEIREKKREKKKNLED